MKCFLEQKPHSLLSVFDVKLKFTNERLWQGIASWQEHSMPNQSGREKGENSAIINIFFININI